MRSATEEPLLQRLYTASACRTLDRRAIDAHGLPGFELMQRAGRAAFEALVQRWPTAHRLLVCCGKGNNAGDGYVVAGLARELGLDVRLHQLGDPQDLRGDAATARDWAVQRGVAIRPGAPAIGADVDVIVDGLLGTGLSGAPRAQYAQAIRAINAAGKPVLALDLPSGLDADSGGAPGEVVRATLTVTFIGRKIGLYTGAGAAVAGTLVFDDLGVPRAAYADVPGIPLLRYTELPSAYRLPPRDRNTYKHALGHVVVIGGDHSMGGAALMAAEAALRAGAGMVSVITRAEHRNAVLARRPEVMVVSADAAAERRNVLDKARCLVIGPGLGRSAWGLELLREGLALGKPTLLDADGLHGLVQLGGAPAGPVVVTPHAGEAARLLGNSAADVQAHRPDSALALARRVGGTAVLKGAGTLVATTASSGEPELLGVCGHGNPGMASAGMGDVLSGLIGGLMAQGLAPAAAAVTGACLHSYAADLAAVDLGQRSLLATDLLPYAMRALAADEART